MTKQDLIIAFRFVYRHRKYDRFAFADWYVDEANHRIVELVTNPKGMYIATGVQGDLDNVGIGKEVPELCKSFASWDSAIDWLRGKGFTIHEPVKYNTKTKRYEK